MYLNFKENKLIENSNLCKTNDNFIWSIIEQVVFLYMTSYSIYDKLFWKMPRNIILINDVYRDKNTYHNFEN